MLPKRSKRACHLNVRGVDKGEMARRGAVTGGGVVTGTQCKVSSTPVTFAVVSAHPGCKPFRAREYVLILQHSHQFIKPQIRSDTSEILDETIPLIKDKVMEMSHIYAKVDKLEAFVKMVAHHVSFLEEQVLEAEKSHGTFLNTVCKLFQCATISSFKNPSFTCFEGACGVLEVEPVSGQFAEPGVQPKSLRAAATLGLDIK
ncbi:PREDICTED: breast carcinoma-amplified sequence 4 [Eurypyga helias]|uniref:breast carcinoma-amplified sequence 4 n=1 Tax=Eurypyga helias TaxID=54383 RepID=UPI0005292B86|nr:PREDICTED: breast carcinoma-amplified sequence 4 [Eurypyga helias]